ncbi:MAG: DUF4352 domain-containing protein [Nitrososphaeria archaeon]
MNTRSFKGISPVIATIIVVAVAITISLAVAFWAAGLTGAFTRFEKLEITNSYVARNADDYTIEINFKNTGTDYITLIDILVGEKPLASYWSLAQVNGSSFSPISVPTGFSGHISIVFPDDGGNKAFTSGQTVVVKVQTAAGVYYVGTFVIP